MISKEELKEILKTTKILDSKPRKKYTDEINSWLKRKEIIIIKGIRRCGKTHIMHQLIKQLPKKNTFYFNFDDFRFDSYLSIELLETIISLRDESKQSYFFLDEIQRVKGFEKWLRTYYDKEDNIKFIIGGSNISLLTPNLSTVLTGRNITFEIYPLSYGEFQTFTDDSFEKYLEFGGFPEVVLEKDETKKRRLMEQYVTDIVTKDIIDKYEISNTTQLKSLLNFFLNNPGIKISANKLGKQLDISKNSAQKYIDYIKDTFLIFEVPFFSYSAKTKYVGTHASKYYCRDNGIHTITTTRKNLGTLYENLIAINLEQNNKEFFYWQDDVEIDFVTDKKAIQVTATKEIPKREIEAFIKFGKKFKDFKFILINLEKEGIFEGIKYITVENFLKNKK